MFIGHFGVGFGAKRAALAGLSMGGGQTLNFGLGHLDTLDTRRPPKTSRRIGRRFALDVLVQSQRRV